MGQMMDLPKPFNRRELLARITRYHVAKPLRNTLPGALTAEDELISFSNIEVDLAARTLKRGNELFTTHR